MKPQIKIILIDKKGDCTCHRRHKIGDIFDYDTEASRLQQKTAMFGFAAQTAMGSIFSK